MGNTFNITESERQDRLGALKKRFGTKAKSAQSFNLLLLKAY